MKLFFVVDNNEPHQSGGGYYAIFKFAQFLARRGHQVYVYAVHDLGWVGRESGINLYFRPSVGRSNRLLRKIDKLIERVFDFLVVPALSARFAPDWVLGVFKESAIKAVVLGRKLDAPVANFIYECPPWLRDIYGEDAFASAMKDGFTVALWERTRQAYLESTVLLPNSTLAGDYARDWLGTANVREPVYPGVDPQEMPFIELEGNADHRSVLFVGRLVADKNVHLLIQAWRKVPADLVLDIVGSGPLDGRLKELSAGLDNVRFHGYVADGKLWEMFSRTDLVVCPTRFEGFGMPPMQALYFSKPCLASDLPILRSIYGDFIDYFPAGDVDSLARKVVEIVGSPDRSRARGAAGRKFVLENFTWESSAKRIEAILGEASP
jgi:glycosyltransferase involved in cell wall biosynthesis